MKSIKKMIKEQLEQSIMIRFKLQIHNYLKHANIEKKPNSIEEVRGLLFNSGEITEIPSEIFNFTNLEDLMVKNCKLTALPDNIGDLTNLSGLILPGNNITSLPDSICNLQNLDFINLNGSNLNHIPDCISNLDYNNGGNLMVFSSDAHPNLKQKLERLLPNADIN